MNWHLKSFDPNDRAVREAWRDLAERGGGSAVQLPEFVFTCAETLGHGRLALATCGDAARPQAMAIVDLGDRLRPEVFVESQMPLGAWLQAPEVSLEAACRALIAHAPLALQFSIRQIDPNFVSRPPQGPRIDTVDYIETAWVELEGSFDAYWAARGKNLRTNMRRQRDKLSKQGVRARMEILTEPDQMERAVADYAALESRGWKASGGTAVSPDHPQFAFYRLMLQRFAEMGKARVYQYFFDEALVACELCICHRGEMVILKITHDESVTPFSPASLLRQEMFEALFNAADIRRVEFYGPVKDWHTRWTDRKRSIFHVNLYRNAMTGAALRALRKVRARPEPTPPPPASSAAD